MRALPKRLPSPSTLIPSSSLAFSTFSSGGGGGRGRGRGFAPPLPPVTDQDPPPLPSLGHGRGSGAVPGDTTRSPIFPTFPTFLSSASTGRGLGRGIPQPQSPSSPSDGPNPDPSLKKPIFFTRDETQFADPDETLGGRHPSPSIPTLPGAGRGKTPSLSAPKPVETNRHARPRRPIGAPPAESSAGPASAGPKLNREEAIKKAMEALSRGGDGGGGRGRGRGRGVAARGRGRGGRGGRGRRDADDEFELDVGDNADGEKFMKRMGEERMKVLEEVFDEVCCDVLPSPMEDAYLDALHTNNMVIWVLLDPILNLDLIGSETRCL